MAFGVATLFGVMTIILSSGILGVITDDAFNEELYIKSLPNGQLYGHFQFTTTWNVSLGAADGSFNHYHLFPKAFGEILDTFSVRELHLSLTQGHWRHESWGYPVLDASSGAELWVWFMEKKMNIDSAWTDLINVLSGMFCASLNFMDMKTTITPKMSFRPKGITTSDYDRWFTKHVRYASLPRENVCTENLTPWKKLLPCGFKAGLSTLLNAVKLYDASYHSLGIHFRPICMNQDCSQTGVELTQTLGVVFDPVVNLGNSGKLDWTFKRLFGRMVSTSCPLATVSAVYVDVTSNLTEIKLRPEPSLIKETKRGGEIVRYAVYNIPEFVSNNRVLNLDVKYKDKSSDIPLKAPLLTANRFQTGYGQVTGGIMCLIYNNHPTQEITVTYMELIPWFIRMYLHTLKIEYFSSQSGKASDKGIPIKPLSLHYVPGKDFQRPYHLEVAFRIPAGSVTRLSFEFEKQLLKWTDYPPDANHGFYVSSAVISALLPTAHNFTSPQQNSSLISSIFNNEVSPESTFFVRLHTESLLITLPTPDFSMPYNVICLACTVIAIAFGSVHNLTTRKFVVYDPVKHKGILTKLKEKIFRKKPTDATTGDGAK